MKDETFIALSRIANLSQSVYQNEIKAANVAQSHRLMYRAATSASARQIDLLEHDSPLMQKAAAAVLLGDWDSADVQTLERAFKASIRERSLLDSLSPYALTLPGHYRVATVATGFTADTTAEGFPKAVKRPTLDAVAGAPVKATALTILSDAVARLPEGEAVFRRELESAVTRAINDSVVQQVMDALGSPTPTVATPGTDALANLRALVAALPATDGIVVAAPSAIVADLALRAEAAEGFTIRGGEFRPGLSIVATDTDALDTMLAIAASLVAIVDHGLRFQSARHATVEISDAPGTPNASTVMTSLWQQNLVGLLVERSYELRVPANAVAVLEG